MFSTIELDNRLKAFIKKVSPLQPESKDLSKLYWSEITGDAVFSVLLTTDAATFSTKLTKQEVINALTISEQIDKFFTNQALTQADYRQNIQGIIYGNNEYASPGISTAIEDYGVRSVALCRAALELFNDANEILDLYFDTEISTIYAAVTGVDLPWQDYSKSDFGAAITLIENFKKLINNEVATQGDYGATVAKWIKIIG